MLFMKSVIIINFKTYLQGKKVLDLAKKIERVNKKIIVGVQASDVYEVAKKTKLEVYCEHVDYFEVGRNTGFVLPEAVKKDGGNGVFLNHSEHKLRFDVLKKTVNRCRDVKLKVAVFVGSVSEGLKVEKLKPDYIIYEPASLVGGNVSVSKSKPEMIRRVVEKIKLPVLVGAGIKNREDVEIAMKLGAKGFAVSSGIVKSRNPEKVLRSLIEGQNA
jgi:triosephosphate isomerase